MKKILPVLASLLLLTACGGTTSSSITSDASSSETSTSSKESSSSKPESRMIDKEVKVYRLFNRDNDYLDPDINEDKYKLGTVNFSFVKGQEFIPYITLEDAAELYSKFYTSSDMKNIVVEEGDEHTWSIDKGSETIFTSAIYTDDKIFTYVGGLGDNVETKKDYTKYSIFLRSKTETSQVVLGDECKYSVSYAETEFEVIEEEDATYFPFSMIHSFYHEVMGHDFFYNYTYLYEYNDSDDISKATVTDGEEVYTPMEQMSKYIDEHVSEKDAGNKPLMPMYLRKHHRSEFALTMLNYYGLSETWGVENMIDFYKAYGIYDQLIDENAAVRGAAYSEAFFMLSDGHTGRTILGDNPWVESNGSADVPAAEKSAFSVERGLLSSALTAQREQFLKANGFEDGIKNALIYSSDGKTAYLGFDGFEGLTNAYRADGSVKSDEQLAEKDSYFYFLKMFKEIVAHNQAGEVKVENVIIDDSLNGGGYVGVMGKLLALLSKDNNAVLTSINDITNYCSKTVYHVDSNNDGKYDANDVYGNMFKFYILTSPYSFSCGNAFPIFAQKQFDHVKVIGAKSGGGECVVGENYISNGMAFVHSSNEHIIVLDEKNKTYDGVERGVSVDATIKYNDFYNMDAMIKAINGIR